MDLPAPASSRRPATLRKPSPLPLLVVVVTIALVVAGYHHLSARVSSAAAAPVVPVAEATADGRTAAAAPSAGEVAAAAAVAGAVADAAAVATASPVLHEPGAPPPAAVLPPAAAVVGDPAAAAPPTDAAAAAAAADAIPPPGGDPASIVRSLVASQPVLIFSKSYCPYSTQAKAALAAAVPAGAPPPTVVELDLREDGAALQAALQAATGRSTVPNVFLGGHPVGGSDEVAALAAEGKLDALVREAPAQLVAKTA